MKEGQALNLDSNDENTLGIINLVQRTSTAALESLFSEKKSSNPVILREASKMKSLLSSYLEGINPEIQKPIPDDVLKSVALDTLTYIYKHAESEDKKQELKKRVSEGTYDSFFEIDQAELESKIKAIDPNYSLEKTQQQTREIEEAAAKKAAATTAQSAKQSTSASENNGLDDADTKQLSPGHDFDDDSSEGDDETVQSDGDLLKEFEADMFDMDTNALAAADLRAARAKKPFIPSRPNPPVLTSPLSSVAPDRPTSTAAAQPSLSAGLSVQPSGFNILTLVDVLHADGTLKTNGFEKVQGAGTDQRVLTHNRTGDVTVKSDGSMSSGPVKLEGDNAKIAGELANKLIAMMQVYIALGDSTNPQKLPPLPIDLKINQNNIPADQKPKADAINELVKQFVAEKAQNFKNKELVKAMFRYDGKAIEPPQNQQNLTTTAAAKSADPAPTSAKPLRARDPNVRRGPK